ncbi:sulfur carrier protein ThiS [Paracoccus tibetensis]|uniref:Sulfur carrier protein n=1 Tax=Paracoccus tibetensis TaxID=336292 RepID=A0A1G5DKN0_9RHOB|nr:sulfur carrier protein ThiS [Paracoccus tibetensis]SCY14978.1 sulfur carrier protein [Paracoccus tibetensis]
MKIELNGAERDIAAATVAEALDELGFGDRRVATALNGAFLPASARPVQRLHDGDRLEVLTPMQGG